MQLEFPLDVKGSEGLLGQPSVERGEADVQASCHKLFKPNAARPMQIYR
jgi:hypothetical protein